MQEEKCPACGSHRFYVKNPDDEYDVREFECRDGEIIFEESEEDPEDPAPAITPKTQTYCSKCAWHDCYEVLKK
jgi:Zn finger protein HypA/HybF involved in hydrogenase expression